MPITYGRQKPHDLNSDSIFFCCREVYILRPYFNISDPVTSACALQRPLCRTEAAGLKIGSMNSLGNLLMMIFCAATILLMGKVNAAFEGQIDYEDAAASFGSPLPMMSGVNTFCSAPSFGQLAWTLISLAIYALL